MITILLKDCTNDGTCLWRVQVDQRIVCDFAQSKQSTLKECLKNAAQAVEISNWIDEVIVKDAKGG